MLYNLISNKRDEWLASDGCVASRLVGYISGRGMMRDAQTEAIKTYLFLKIACRNRPLWELFADGEFNSIDIDRTPLSAKARDYLKSDKAATALLEYSRLRDRSGRQIAPELEKLITERLGDIDYRNIFKQIFYGVDYPDYLFSLPMGAGKTFLMAAFIYLDLYFAQNEPDNPCFAHNFMILAPSGLKSSIVPSLKHIAEFDPSWVIPEPAASGLRRTIKFEVLDEQGTAKKSNLTRNPNAQKINNHQPLEDLMGLVAVTNAEKVILDRVGDDDGRLLEREEMARMTVANELRNIIGRIPHLAIYIDEVHHAADSEIKLRQVVTGWAKGKSFCGMLGFSGTPYLEKAESVKLSERLSVRSGELANVVYNYPLISGVGNFLKVPTVKYAESDPATIIRNGVTDFLKRYKDTVYPDGTLAKLAIYCGQIKTLEESVFPQVSELVGAFGMNPSEAILKYHGGNNDYPAPVSAETAFASLDTTMSKVRVILLVQIGKEGWDCRSLTGVVLPQKGVCPKNMVLQTSCRCLRQVARTGEETALIWLNKWNADTLNAQLKQQQDTSISELNRYEPAGGISIVRHSRMEKMRVPPIDFYQLKVSFRTLVIEEQPDTSARLADEGVLVASGPTLIHQQDFTGKQTGLFRKIAEEETPMSFSHWLWLVSRESFGTLSVGELKRYEMELRGIFDRITHRADGQTVLSGEWNQQEVRAVIRRAFTPKRRLEVKEEVVPCKARLLQIERLVSPLKVNDDHAFYPPQGEVEKIVEWDGRKRPEPLSAEVISAMKLLASKGYNLPDIKDPHPEREQTYHYLPYRFDSGLEHDYFIRTLIPLLTDRKLEYYFNGDDTLTEFKIDCYRRSQGGWRYIGKYVPDFLLISRDAEGKIHKIAIVETKGEGFAAGFTGRREFMGEFVRANNERFGYERFRFLYLEETLKPDEQAERTMGIINDFFND